MEKSKERLAILKKIEEYEKNEKWDQDVEQDLPTIELLPNKVDYLNKKLSSKIKSFIANKLAASYFEKLIKQNQLIIKKIVGIENFLSVPGGAILTCNHFNACDNYAVFKAIKPYMKKRNLYKVIREGNYTNYPGIIGFFFKHCNTLPLSSNFETMKKFINAIKVLLSRGEKILIYPEQSMWWNYRKPKPLKNGAFHFAVLNNVPVIPFFITMEDSKHLDDCGFPVQEYTIHIEKPIYPDKNLPNKEQIIKMKDENYNVWKSIYEKAYNKKLIYKTQKGK